jgi:hypothetical protein
VWVPRRNNNCEVELRLGYRYLPVDENKTFIVVVAVLNTVASMGEQHSLDDEGKAISSAAPPNGFSSCLRATAPEFVPQASTAWNVMSGNRNAAYLDQPSMNPVQWYTLSSYGTQWPHGWYPLLLRYIPSPKSHRQITPRRVGIKAGSRHAREAPTRAQKTTKKSLPPPPGMVSVRGSPPVCRKENEVAITTLEEHQQFAQTHQTPAPVCQKLKTIEKTTTLPIPPVIQAVAPFATQLEMISRQIALLEDGKASESQTPISA